MVRVVLDLHDERHAILAFARQAPVEDVPAFQQGVELTQIASREPHVYLVANNRSQHVFLLKVTGACAPSGDARSDRKYGSKRSGPPISLTFAELHGRAAAAAVTK
jgi:hypothetical protein